MQNTRKITDDLVYVGVSDRRGILFENVYPIPNGVSYNNYVLLDDQTVLFDCADLLVAEQFMANVEGALSGRDLNYLVVHHMEPDHGATIEMLMRRHPETTIVTSAKAATMIGQFFDFNIEGRLKTVGEGDTLTTGRHTLSFVAAPMVHWPEVIMTYDATDKILFSADAFGSFGALNGKIFADEMHIERDWLNEMRRYLINIVGKYGVQVQNVLKKAAGLDICMICPLHGPIWREDLGYLIEKYNIWSSYQAEEKGVVIIYGSIYGHTAAAAECLATMLAEEGVGEMALYDASHTDVSYLVSEAFRYSHLVVASSTYNNGIFTPIENFVAELKAHNYQNRHLSIIENGSWAPQSGKLLRAEFETMKGMTFVGETISLKSAMKEVQETALRQLAQEIIQTL